MIDINIDNALKDNQFVLYYQPQVFSRTNQIIAVEALIRVKKDSEVILPNSFIPDAEKSGDIVKIDKWVFKKIAEDAEKLHKITNKKITLSFNVSALHFQDKNIVKDLENLAKTSRNFLQNLEIEITENSLLIDIDKAKDDIAYLKKIGYKISIDDFGTGYGSFAYIHNFPIDNIKFDKSFVDDICGENKKSLTILQSLIFLCARLKIKLIVEGVETIDQINVLKKLGCYNVQGFYFAKPMPLEEVVKYLTTSFWSAKAQNCY